MDRKQGNAMLDFRGLLGGKSEEREAFIRATASHNIKIKRAFGF